MKIIIATIIVLIGEFIMLAKVCRTGNRRMLILEAIGTYMVQTQDYSVTVHSLIDSMEDFDKTFWRLWDWGYTNILPPDKFEIIKPYIKEK